MCCFLSRKVASLESKLDFIEMIKNKGIIHALLVFARFTVQIVQVQPLSYLFSVSFMMVEALEENVMKDILNIGLQKKKKKERKSA